MKKIFVHHPEHSVCCHEGVIQSLPRDLNDRDYFTCPMHPSLRRLQLGYCPECGMALEPLVNVGQERDDLKSAWWHFLMALFFTILLVVLMWGKELVAQWLSPSNARLIQLLCCTPVCLWTALPLYERGLWGIRQFRLNMYSLISVGVLLTFSYSVIATLVPSFFPASFLDIEGNPFLYFEAAAVMVTLVWLGQVLELKTRDRTSSALRELLYLSPSRAHLVHPNGDEQDIEIDLVKVGDVLRVLPGETIPVDGYVIAGKSAVNEAKISGEAIPIEKEAGSQVIAGTLNSSEILLIEAKKGVHETVLTQIISLVSEAQRSRAYVQRFADKVVQVLVPAVLIGALITFLIWMLFGPAPQFQLALLCMISVVMIACPCALGLATPISVMVAIGRGAQAGIYFKNAQSLEQMAQINTIIFDKTGTLTQGHLSLVGIEIIGHHNKKNLIKMAASLAQHSQQPFALAMLTYAAHKEVSLLPVEKFLAQPGLGIEGKVLGHKVLLGNRLFLEQQGIDFSQLPSLEESGFATSSVLNYLAMDGHLSAIFAFDEQLKQDANNAIDKLKKQKLRIIMVSGDSEENARYLGEKLGISEVYGNMSPEAKGNLVESLRRAQAKVAFVGDSINNAPALLCANVGITLGNGTETIIGGAPVSLLKGDLEPLVRAYTLSHRTSNNIKQNLFWAFLYNTLGLPIAAGVLYSAFGIIVHPMLAAAAMSFSSIAVIVNALRLRSVKL